MISSATIADDVLIKANIRALYRSRYHCKKEIDILSSRIQGDLLKEKIALRKLSKGCGHVLKTLVDKIEDVEFYTCLCSLFHPLMDTLINLHNILKQGVLPFSGGYLEQPSQVIELLNITNKAINSEEEEKERLLNKLKEQNARRKY